MACMPGLVVPGQGRDISPRGNNRQPVFFSGQDFRIQLETSHQAAATHGGQYTRTCSLRTNAKRGPMPVDSTKKELYPPDVPCRRY